MAAAEVKLEFPEEYTLEKSNQKIAKKMNLLKQKGLEKITDFEGYSFTESMFYLYLLKKYKSPCFLTESSGNHWDILGINLVIKEIYPPEESTQINNYLQRLAKKLVNCINNNVNIIIIPLSLILHYPDGTNGGHANVLIYRKKFNHIEHFEPYGKLNILDYKKLNSSIELFMNIFVEYVNIELFKHKVAQDLKPIELIDANRVCPYFKGFQTLEEESTIFRNLEVEPIGYCSAWSMFFTELCLKNPSMTSSEIIASVFSTSSDKLTTREYFRHIIRGYATFINEKISTYFNFLLEDYKIDFAKIKKMSVQEKYALNEKIKIIINIEMLLSFNPNAINEKIQFLEFVQKQLQKQGSISINEYLRNNVEIAILKRYKNHMNYFNSPIDTPPSPPPLSLVKSNSKTKTQKKPINCPPGKVLNPKTNRCIKVKPDKPIRQAIKERKDKLEQELRNITKICPPGKVLNPDTGRCIKVKTVNKKECPHGKMLNPKTGRCVNAKIGTRKIKK